MFSIALQMNRFASLFFLIICAMFSCNSSNGRISYKAHETLILGHRATGAGVNNGFLENTIPAIEEALKFADGVEVDIQMSKSSSIWLYHDDMFNHLCPESRALIDQYGLSCILNSPDSLIEKLRICRDGIKERIYPINDLLSLLSQHKNKYVSLDVKGYFNTECVSNNNVSRNYIDAIGKRLYNMIASYKVKDKIFVETAYSRLFEQLKEKDPAIKCHLLGFENLPKIVDKAIKLKLDGISFNLRDSSLNAENHKKILQENLQLQLWPIYNEEDFEKGMQFLPLTVQVGSVKLIKTIQEKKEQPYD